ncbi:hypothetical protein [Bartonella sp. DGB1]
MSKVENDINKKSDANIRDDLPKWVTVNDNTKYNCILFAPI